MRSTIRVRLDSSVMIFRITAKTYSRTGTMLTTGEHEYTRYGFRQLLEKRCADRQPDITWLGGLTEARRVVALASSYDVIPAVAVCIRIIFNMPLRIVPWLSF